MSLTEIDEYAHIHVKGIETNPNWTDSAKRPTMEMKTVLRQLLGWADLSGKEHAALKEALKEDLPEDDNTTNGASWDVPGQDADETREGEPAPRRSEEQNLADLGFAPETKTEQGRPLVPTTLRSFLATKASRYAPYEANDNQRGLMTGLMTEAFAPDEDATKIYHSCLVYLWGMDSSKKLKGEQIKATLDWLKPTRDSGGAYLIDPMAARELHAVWTAELKSKGQQELPIE